MVEQLNVQEIYSQLRNCLQTQPLAMDNMVEYRQNAVLIPLLYEQGQLKILFEVRAEHLNWQPGQICFPGGGYDHHQDESFLHTALRECCEELNLCAGDVEVLGALNPIASPVGVEIYPFLGVIKHPEKISPAPAEVAQIFTVPVDFFYEHKPQMGVSETATRITDDFPLDLVSSFNYKKEWQMRSRYKVYFYPYSGHVIWGLTAHMLRSLLKRYRSILQPGRTQGREDCL